MKKVYPVMLSIAGSDSCGGAGIQADIKTASSIGCYAATAITAVTVQNTTGVKGFQKIESQCVAKQIEAVFEDINVDSVKIGMIPDSETMDSVAEVLNRYKPEFLVLDPVMVSTSGHKLMSNDAIETLIEKIIPLAYIITPNIPEAEVLLGKKISSNADIEAGAKLLAEKFNVNVLLKAGHLEGEVLTDIFYDKDLDEVYRLSSGKIDTINTHGTGCTLSSAIASYLALGYGIKEAVTLGKEYLYKALCAGAEYSFGNGHGPVAHHLALK